MAFVPFYRKENTQRIKPKHSVLDFPNYLSRDYSNYQENNDQRIGKEAPVSFHIDDDQMVINSSPYQANRASVRPDRSEAMRRRKEINDQRQNSPYQYKQNSIREDKREKQARLRREIKEFQMYQSKKPFKPTELPSTWLNSQSSTPVQDKGTKTELPPRSPRKKTAPPRTSEKQELASTNQPNSNKSKARPKKHLNRGLQSIMAEERPLKGNSFLGQDDGLAKDQPPFKKHQDGNGDK
ncbi:hypothetical protein [Aerococcus urinae]|uniref:Uncharacterized protein n=1 Tax=Aerococcus urinae TaxID=1376 RepID=A0A109RES3_9LACT|nr:hypothetical protein [Aerococcus urinae]AMB96141.1 hypothetical protein AWM73_06290 [Aerococcus urinae]MCY3033183.1 hypothetical protein [Aerococcus urinae]MCY3038415.1 hypothetical protein [Aerococcus urinae]MCY3045374.1 hypothetical protein [Aerococcus urinae]MCY3047149.1 hypothetical protein [Aerococcus urinae]